MFYGLAADGVAAFHFAYVAFVVVGELAILLGAACRWGWVRNPTFRFLHLLAIAVVALEAVGNIDCPLTLWENHLRGLAGQEVLGGSFVGRIVDTVFCNGLWDQWVYNLIHIGFGLLVLATFVLVPPRFRRRLRPAVAQPPAVA
jgi:hypothetical protein